MKKKTIQVKRALLSVFDKEGLVDFARRLTKLEVEIISTGGTAKILRQHGIAVTTVAAITGFPEIMGGRVKTLHPKIQGGILGRRDQDAAEAQKLKIGWIDLVVCNLYPFSETIQQPKVDLGQAIEQIDIGGPTMIRSAAKNFAGAAVVVDPADYSPLLHEITSGGISLATRQKLATKAFAYTAQYDTLIHQYLQNRSVPKLPATLNLTFNKRQDLRYGENPHQTAALYQNPRPAEPSVVGAKIHQGKELSYNNIADAAAALSAVLEFSQPACVVVKHANPAGAAVAGDITQAFIHAYQSDPVSAFGGIVALNRPCPSAIAEEINKVFLEVLLAPSYEPAALKLLAKKPAVRVLELGELNKAPAIWEYRSIPGGLLVQESDRTRLSNKDLQVATTKEPTKAELADLLFARQVVKHVKSNAIVIAKNGSTLGIGAGQVSRIDAVELALKKAGDKTAGAVLSSDAFFPFRDSIDLAALAGIAAVIQPGGSRRDQEVIAAGNKHGLTMVFTGRRCFRH